MSKSEPSTLLFTFKEIEAPSLIFRFAPFSSVRVELLAKFSEDPSAMFN